LSPHISSTRTIKAKFRIEAVVAFTFVLVLLILGGLLISSGLSFDESIAYITESIRSLAEPDPQDLSSILPPWSSFGYRQENDIKDNTDKNNRNDKNKNDINDTLVNQKEKEEYFPVVTRGGILVRPLLTLVLGWESVIADPTCYDVKRGRYTSFRPGLVDLFLACADAQIEIIIWSRDYPSAIVAEDIRSFILKQVIPNDIKRYNDFLSFLRSSRAKAIAAEYQLAKEENRLPREMSSFIEELDTQPLYETSILRIAAILGKEHCYSKSRPLGLVLSRRDLKNVRVIDSIFGKNNSLVKKEWEEAIQLSIDEGRLINKTEQDVNVNNNHVLFIKEYKGGDLETQDRDLLKVINKA
jgi:hypothetical protein